MNTVRDLTPLLPPDWQPTRDETLPRYAWAAALVGEEVLCLTAEGAMAPDGLALADWQAVLEWVLACAHVAPGCYPVAVGGDAVQQVGHVTVSSAEAN